MFHVIMCSELGEEQKPLFPLLFFHSIYTQFSIYTLKEHHCCVEQNWIFPPPPAGVAALLYLIPARHFISQAAVATNHSSFPQRNMHIWALSHFYKLTYNNLSSCVNLIHACYLFCRKVSFLFFLALAHGGDDAILCAACKAFIGSEPSMNTTPDLWEHF